MVLCLIAMIICESELPNEYTTLRNYAVLKENNIDHTNHNAQDPIIVQKYQIHSKTSAKSFTSKVTTLEQA